MEDILKFLYDTCIQAGPGVSYSLGQHSAVTAQTPPTDSNIWWRTVKAAADAMYGTHLIVLVIRRFAKIPFVFLQGTWY